MLLRGFNEFFWLKLLFRFGGLVYAMEILGFKVGSFVFEELKCSKAGTSKLSILNG